MSSELLKPGYYYLFVHNLTKLITGGCQLFMEGICIGTQGESACLIDIHSGNEIYASKYSIGPSKSHLATKKELLTCLSNHVGRHRNILKSLIKSYKNPI